MLIGQSPSSAMGGVSTFVTSQKLEIANGLFSETYDLWGLKKEDWVHFYYGRVVLYTHMYVQ